MSESRCILSPTSHSTLGDNLNGPCIIEVPEWINSPLARFYMYFAHHKGRFIRMAYADALTGPWQIYAPGVLGLQETPYAQSDLAAGPGYDFSYAHIASPNVHIDSEAEQIVMYYHGLEVDGSQPTRVCFSSDGLSFENHSEPLVNQYFAGFVFESAIYGITWGGRLHRADTWAGPFQDAPEEFARAMFGADNEVPRHCGVQVDGNQLSIYFTRIGDAPERVFRSTCTLSENWHNWRTSTPVEVLRPTKVWEGASTPIEKSRVGSAQPMEHALRDPFPFRDHLFFAAGGESAIGVAPLSHC